MHFKMFILADGRGQISALEETHWKKHERDACTVPVSADFIFQIICVFL